MNCEEKIIDALEFAKNLGIKIIRGPVFDWVHPEEPRIREFPYGCNAIGGILLKLEKQDLVSNYPPYFKKGWMNIVYEYLGVNDFWIWRFGQGFNGGYQITFDIKQKDGKEKIVKDDISALGISIRKRFL